MFELSPLMSWIIVLLVASISVMLGFLICSMFIVGKEADEIQEKHEQKILDELKNKNKKYY